MNTTRRSFLARTLGALAAVPVAALATRSAGSNPPTSTLSQPISCGTPMRVEGIGIKVPSNRRWHRPKPEAVAYEITHAWYDGPWDGTFKEEHGCSNPAYILADLYTRTDEESDWVVGEQVLPLLSRGYPDNYRCGLNWPMLYDWGRWCDEVVTYRGGSVRNASGPCQLRPYKCWIVDPAMGPRFTVNTVCQTHEDMVQLRETLRMHCLSWQSTDPRYRRSYPGIPYPGDRHG